MKHFEVFVSQAVHDEAKQGDAEAAARRVDLIKDFTVLRVTDNARDLALSYLRDLPLPGSAFVDALHLAVASLNNMDFLITWNCRHIARGSVKRLLPELNQRYGYRTPTICTPEELMYENENLG